MNIYLKDNTVHSIATYLSIRIVVTHTYIVHIALYHVYMYVTDYYQSTCHFVNACIAKYVANLVGKNNDLND